MGRKRDRKGRAFRTRKSLWIKHNTRCVDCNISTKFSSIQTSDQATIEHIIPKSLGGSNSRENLTLLCYNCNQNRNSVLEARKHYLKYYKRGYAMATGTEDEEQLLRKMKNRMRDFDKAGFKEGYAMGEWALKFRK